MGVTLTRPLEGARARVAPAFDLVPFDHLAGPNVERFRRVAQDPVWAGVLLPNETGWRRAHLVTRETAALLAEMHALEPLPSSIGTEVWARLVLDGILELECDGSIHSGPSAYPLFFSAETAEPRGILATLSLEAMRYAVAAGLTDPRELAARLYLYNTQPCSPAWHRRFPGRDAVERLLEQGGQPRTACGQVAWEELATAHYGRKVWRVWDAPDAPLPREGAPTYKLYISPRLECVGPSLAAVLSLFGTAFAPFSVKVGRDLPTLLRPDKMVAYFTEREQLLESAARLRQELGGAPVQGVPFTAELVSDGLLSEAADPADEAEPPGPRRQGSWRGWVTARLAGAMTAAVGGGSPVAPVQYALARVSLDGVDTAGWVPPVWFGHHLRTDADH